MPLGQNPSLEMYLRMLFPWGQDHDHLWKCVTWTWYLTNDKGELEKKFANFGAQDIAGIVHLIETRAGRVNTDVYVGLGAYRMASQEKKTSDGYFKVPRLANNVASHNSIYLDIDVGKEGGYATTDDAFAALDDFIDKMNLPDPTMEVLSGTGGIHVYWCVTDPIPLVSWQPLSAGLRDAAVAYGLKFDPQCTVDAARILRPPGTWNCKTTPPKQVRLMEDSSFARYDYQTLVGALSPYVGPTAGMRAVQQGVVGKSLNHNLIANVSVQAAPVALDDVVRVCPTVADIDARAGNGDSEPLWNLAMMLASFTDDPVASAHRLSRGDPRYTQAETDKKLQEKITARAQNPAIGWPQCSSFGSMHAACQTCPLFAQQKSPLHFANRVTPATPAVPAGTDPLMPPGYWRGTNQHVYTTVVDEKTKQSHTVDIFEYPILDAAIDDATGYLVVLAIKGGVHHWASANVHSNLQPAGLCQSVAAQQIFIKPVNFKVARDFIVAWMKHLQDIKKYTSRQGFGWGPGGTSFVLDQTAYSPTGSAPVYRGSSRNPDFIAIGDLKPWQDAMQLVYGNGHLEVATAASFAAPLVDLISTSSLVLSLYSDASGVGKTTALMLGQAVWGNPRTGLSALSDTLNSTMEKIGELRHLPVFWDELHTTEQVDKVVELTFQISQGKTKSRLNRDATQKPASAFTTMIVIASNSGLEDAIYSRTEGTEAGGLRLFEMEVAPRQSSRFSAEDAKMLLKGVETNYGRAGHIYAEFLANNRAGLKSTIFGVMKLLDQKHNLQTKERFWANTMAAIIVGAHAANTCGLTTFDLKLIEKTVDDLLIAQRGTLTRQAYMTQPGTGVSIDTLNDIMNDVRGRHLLITDRINYGAGRPSLVDASATGDLTKLANIWIQFGHADQRIRVRTKPFNTWLREHRMQPNRILKLLEKHYIVTHRKSSIGQGVPFLDALSNQRVECIDFTPRNGPSASPGSS